METLTQTNADNLELNDPDRVAEGAADRAEADGRWAAWAESHGTEFQSPTDAPGSGEQEQSELSLASSDRDSTGVEELTQ
ncbi:MAG: hypothetical protein WD467_02410 [Candidatus Saccharimonadales bacterium]